MVTFGNVGKAGLVASVGAYMLFMGSAAGQEQVCFVFNKALVLSFGLVNGVMTRSYKSSRHGLRL